MIMLDEYPSIGYYVDKAQVKEPCPLPAHKRQGGHVASNASTTKYDRTSAAKTTRIHRPFEGLKMMITASLTA
jgi:hypothetical protein